MNRIDALGVSILCLLTVALLPGFFHPMDARHGLVLMAMPLGAWLLLRAAVAERDGAAIAGLAFVLVVCVSALRSDFAGIAVLGTTGHELSVVMVFGAFCWWAIGRHLTPAGRTALSVLLVWAAAINIAIGVYQIALNPARGIYFGYGGRLSGLMANPVYFASTFVGVWAYWHVRASSGASRHRLLLLAAGLATAVGLSGSRGGAAIGISICVLGCIARPRRSTLIASAVSATGFIVGLAAIRMVSPDQVERLGTSHASAGLRLRIEVWKVGIRAWSERPVIGWGADPYQNELNRRIPADVNSYFGQRVTWTDPHNVAVLVLLIGGVLGVVALTWFVVAGLRGRVDLALLVASIAIVLSWTLEPIMSNGWPIAFALFGAAVRPSPEPSEDSDTGRLAGTLIVLGVVVGMVYLGWSIRLQQAVEQRDPDMMEARAGWMIRDIEVSTSIARFHKNADADGAELERHLARAESLAADAVERSGYPGVWGLLTEIQVIRGDPAAAVATAQEWANAWPEDAVAFRLLALSAGAAGDQEAEEAAILRACEITPTCDPSIDD